jgi:hypothetical protein
MKGTQAQINISGQIELSTYKANTRLQSVQTSWNSLEINFLSVKFLVSTL